METKLLPAPYGYAEGYHISLRSHEGFDPAATKSAIMAYGCPGRIADKAISCLKSSNRYDCVVSPQWFSSVGQLRDKLGRAGVDMETLHKPDPKDPGRMARKLRQGIRFNIDAYDSGQYRTQADNLPRYLTDIGKLLATSRDYLK